MFHTSTDMYGRWSDEIFNDSVEVFLAKQVNESKVVNVSTDDSILEVSKGQVSDSSQMDLWGDRWAEDNGTAKSQSRRGMKFFDQRKESSEKDLEADYFVDHIHAWI